MVTSIVFAALSAILSIAPSEFAMAQRNSPRQAIWSCHGYSVADDSYQYCGTAIGASSEGACGPNFYDVTCQLLTF